ncbi:phage terminase small subunit [Chengkuizengella sp. SCS-71B]|uniref:phage terminase small subunit n=1 Tax=Chengkuizengella sp. SCS-71B TaxID=3115290 RepID=UPI0032C24011
MAKVRSPNRDKALDTWLEHKGKISNRELASLLGEKEKTISNWKCRDQWNVVLQTGKRSTTNKSESKGGAPKGNKNAKGNRGGAAPTRNTNAVSHGFFKRIFPDDEETLHIVKEIETKSPLDLLWENIVIQYTAIIRAQKIMFVQNQQDETRVLKKQKQGDDLWEEEWEYQHSWDKQANFLQAQARALSTLTSMIKQYEEMCRQGWANEEQQLRIQKLKTEVNKLNEESNPDPVIFKDDLHE